MGIVLSSPDRPLLKLPLQSLFNRNVASITTGMFLGATSGIRAKPFIKKRGLCILMRGLTPLILTTSYRSKTRREAFNMARTTLDQRMRQLARKLRPSRKPRWRGRVLTFEQLSARINLTVTASFSAGILTVI